MTTNIDALKALYVALGGTANEFTAQSIPDAITQIATVAAAVTTAANAKELPTVKAANNGQVLTVVSGAWAAANLPE